MNRTFNGIERPAFTPEFITELKTDEIFVFGSNLAGMHGGGAAYVSNHMWMNSSPLPRLIPRSSST